MNPEQESEFHQNMSQLMKLLKKIIANLPSQENLPALGRSLKNADISVNLFFTFLPITPEELDELEDAFDHFLFHRCEGAHDDSPAELSPADLEFLRRHGIRF